ncbi:MAG: hypothetical protein N2111_14065 [Candidatus Sumerlaeaceae bacterium]|nr:hypothetical protein [Candidatus Sumerlaeaceae bacterium]
MTLRKGQQRFTKEEIVEILRRNVNLFRDEEEFVEYIVDLAIYLVEHKLRSETESDAAPSGAAAAAAAEEIIVKRTEQFLKGRRRDIERFDLLSPAGPLPAPDDTSVPVCRICGSETGGRKMCPNCGSIC